MFGLPPIPRADLKRLGEWIEALRSLAALLFIPALCAYGAALVYVLVALPWPEATASQRITFIGSALIGVLLLIGLGTLWLQRRDIPNVSISGPGFQATISDAEGEGGQK